MADMQMDYNNAFDESKELFTPEMENGKWLESKYNDLTKFQKKGIFGGRKEDSYTFTNIKNSLNTLNGLLNMNLSGNNKDALGTLTLVYNAYLTLIGECDKYLTDKKGNTRNATTQLGQYRIGIVKEVKQYAEKDINAVRGQMFLPENLRGTTIKEAIGKARMREINLTKAESEYKHVGGNASNLLVIPKNSEGTSNEFFSDLKIIDRNNEYKNVLPQIEKLKKRSNINEESKNKVIEAILNSGKTDRDSIYSIVNGDRNKYGFSEDSEAVKFAVEISKLMGAIKTGYDNIFQSDLTNVESDRVNMNAHNVATSRIADLFGRGDLIAKSEMAVVKEYGNNTERVGSVMEGVEGEDAITTLRKDLGKYSKDEGRKLTPKEFKDKVAGLIKGDFQRDLSDLQVIDYLCGQIDRHFGNYFVQKDSKGDYIGVKGIDNDLSFGNMKEREKAYNYGIHGRVVVDSSANLIIPHMSLELAIRINMINDSMVKYALMDLIAKPEIAAFCERLSLLKEAIRKEFEKGEKGTIFVAKDDWNEKTLEHFMKARHEIKSNDENNGTSNYVGRFIEDFAGMEAYQRNEYLEN